MSREIGRQVGLLVDRQGRPALVLVGDPGSILIPDLPRSRLGQGRLRGLRLIHTHLSDDLLTQDDLMDLVFLRLDLVLALTVDERGGPDRVQYAHLLPPNPEGRAYEISPPARFDRPRPDLSALVRAMEEEFGRAERTREAASGRERALLVGVSTLPREVQERALDELAALADTAGLEAVGRVVQRVKAMNPKSILGKGKLSEMEVLALQTGAQVILFDLELTPSQMRNLADLTERKVLDRTQLILDIFAQHAKSREGKLQVEMAQLKYALPRLVGRNKAMDRLMGGIGGRGPGETKLEIDRRRVRERIDRLKKDLDEVRRQRASTRERRAKAGLPVISLVGYTNAGKSTLLNALTRSQVLAEDKLFATLDPASRRIRFPQDREVILTDTVGFIRHLPEELKEAFRATLEELQSADVLVHVADASHPEVEEQVRAVESILRDMDLHERPTLLVLNKWDRVGPDRAEQVRNALAGGIPASALDRVSLAPVVEAILALLPEDGPVSRDQEFSA